jgi:hypothetical protein
MNSVMVVVLAQPYAAVTRRQARNPRRTGKTYKRARTKSK